AVAAVEDPQRDLELELRATGQEGRRAGQRNLDVLAAVFLVAEVNDRVFEGRADDRVGDHRIDVPDRPGDERVGLALGERRPPDVRLDAEELVGEQRLARTVEDAEALRAALDRPRGHVLLEGLARLVAEVADRRDRVRVARARETALRAAVVLAV